MKGSVQEKDGESLTMSDLRRENAFPLRLLKKDPEIEELRRRLRKKREAAAEKSDGAEGVEAKEGKKEGYLENISISRIQPRRSSSVETVKKSSFKIISRDVKNAAAFKLPTLGKVKPKNTYLTSNGSLHLKLYVVTPFWRKKLMYEKCRKK